MTTRSAKRDRDDEFEYTRFREAFPWEFSSQRKRFFLNRTRASLGILPDDILYKIIAQIRDSMSPRELLTTIGSVNKRFRKLCFASEFWSGDALVRFVEADRITAMIKNMRAPLRITNLALSNDVLHGSLKGESHAFRTGVSALMEVLKFTPSVTHLVMVSCEREFPATFSESLRSLPLTTLEVSAPKCTSETESWVPLSGSGLLSLVQHCSSLTDLSAAFKWNGAKDEHLDFLDLLQRACPNLVKLKISQVPLPLLTGAAPVLDLSPLLNPTWKLTTLTLANLDVRNTEALQGAMIEKCVLTDCQGTSGAGQLAIDNGNMCFMESFGDRTFNDVSFRCCLNLKELRIIGVSPSVSTVSIESCPNLETILVRSTCLRSLVIRGCPMVSKLQVPHIEQSLLSNFRRLKDLSIESAKLYTPTAINNAVFASTLTRMSLRDCTMDEKFEIFELPALQSLILRCDNYPEKLRLECPELRKLDVDLHLAARSYRNMDIELQSCSRLDSLHVSPRVAKLSTILATILVCKNPGLRQSQQNLAALEKEFGRKSLCKRSAGASFGRREGNTDKDLPHYFNVALRLKKKERLQKRISELVPSFGKPPKSS